MAAEYGFDLLNAVISLFSCITLEIGDVIAIFEQPISLWLFTDISLQADGLTDLTSCR
jgi:hypothetical protein